MKNDITGMDNTYYQRACQCSDCGRKIPAGELVHGYCYNGRSLTYRICDDCHDAKETRILSCKKRV